MPEHVASIEAEQSAALIDEKAHYPGKTRHVYEEKQRPAVSLRLALNDGERTHALAGKGEEY